MSTAASTREGLIHRHHRSADTALPRVSLNGDFQDILFVRTPLF